MWTEGRGMSMSTPNGNVKVRAASGNAVEIAPPAQDVTAAEPNLTAAQVKARLQEIGREITARLIKADKQTQLAKDHVIAVNKLLDEAKELCDVDDFKKFHELYCPKLGKSQAYELLAIAAGKKTLAEHRTEERERKKKTRANQKAKFRDVPEKSEPDAQDATSLVPQRTPECSKAQSAVTPNDIGVSGFNSLVMELVHRIGKHKAEHFAGTAVPKDDLARLGKFLTDVAHLKKSDSDASQR